MNWLRLRRELVAQRMANRVLQRRVRELEVVRDPARVEVIDHRGQHDQVGERGRVYVAYEAKVDLVFQDDGRTLKVFVTDRP